MLQDSGYHVPPSVETGCLLYSFIILERKRSTTNMFRSFDIVVAIIPLLSGSITTHIHINSEPTFICVSSTINSEIVVLL
jgi:hypothetical protein